MYIIKADGVVIYNPASDDSARKVLEPRAKFKLNKAGSLEFTMLPDNVMYGRLQKMKSVVTLEQDGKIIFQGRVLDTVTDIDRHINVYCEGALGYLMDSAVRPYTYEGGATGLFYQLVAQHNAQVDGFKQFSVGSVTAAVGETLEEYDSDSCANTLNEIRQMLVDPYGGYLRVRYSGGSKYLDYIDAYGTSSGQTLEYGVNMVAMEDAYELGNIYSVLVPLGAYYTEEDKKEEEGGEAEPATVAEGEETEGTEEETPEEEVDETIGEDGLKKKLKIAGVVTIEKVNGGSDYLIDSDMLSKYGRVVKAHRWENVDDPLELMNKGYELLERNKDARSIKLRAVDLHVINASVDTIELGDSVRLVSNPHGLSLTDICSAIDLDIEYPEYTEYTFGIAPETLTEQNASASRRASYRNSSFLRWLTETDTSLNIAVKNVDLINGKLTQVGIDVDALEGAVTIWADQIDNLVTQTAELKVKYDEITAKVENNSGQISQLRIDVDSISLWSGTIDELGNRLDGAEIVIDGLKEQIDLNAKNIALNAENIAANAKNIQLNADKIQANADDIELNAKNIALNADKIQMVADELDVQADRITVNSEQININSEQINVNSEQINVNSEQINVVAGELNVQAERIETNAKDIETNAQNIETNAINITTNANNIETNAQRIETNAKYIETNAQSIVTNAKNIETNAQNIQVNANAIAVNAENISVIAGRVDVQAETITAQAKLISAKADQVDLEAQTVRINAVETTITGLVKTEDLETEVLKILEYAWADDMDIVNLVASSINTSTLSADSITTDTINGGTPATQEWIEEQGFLTTGEGTEGSIATQEWVKDQGYATQAWVNNKDYVLTSSLPSILVSYATKNWVTDQGYLKSIPSTYATQSWVQNQGYLKSVPNNYATQAWVLSQDYAAKSWVEGKGYLTEIPSGYATQDWVAENFSKASVTYKPTVIERYGLVFDNNISVRALNAGGTVLLTGTVDAGDVYEAGEDSVTLSAGEWASNKMTVTASNGETLEVDASSIYSAGANAGFNGGYNMAITGAMIELDGSTVKVYSPDGAIAGPTLDISSNLDAAYDDGYADATPTSVDRTATYVSASNQYTLSVKVKSADGTSRDFAAVAINASAAYNAGYKAAVDSATLTCEGVNAIVTFSDGTTKTLDLSEYVTVTGAIRSIINTAQNYYMAQGYANAYINGVDVDYTTFSKAQSFG